MSSPHTELDEHKVKKLCKKISDPIGCGYSKSATCRRVSNNSKKHYMQKTIRQHKSAVLPFACSGFFELSFIYKL